MFYSQCSSMLDTYASTLTIFHWLQHTQSYLSAIAYWVDYTTKLAQVCN